MTGREFCDLIRHMPRLPDREEAIFQAVADGHYVAVMGRVGQLEVALDYFAIGEYDLDFVRMPVSGLLALRICELLKMRMPTPAEVDAIWKAADVKLEPQPWGPPYDSSMLSVDRLQKHNAEIEERRAGRCGLIAGIKKDIVGCDDVHVWIYGWEHLNGVPIQQFNKLSHEASYADYSHGLRLVRDV